MEGCEGMYETKALLQAHADYAVAVRDRVMYDFVARQLSVQGTTVKAYDDAVKELEESINKGT